MNSPLFTPLHLELMIHYGAKDAPFYRPSQAATDYTEDLLAKGLIEKTACGYEATLAGLAFIRMLCDTPVPVAALLDPRDGKQIES